MSPKACFVLQTEVVPSLKSAIPQAVCFVGSEDPQELVQNSISMAAKLIHSVEKKRKKVTPENIAYYTIQHLKSGHRNVGYSAADVMASATQFKSRSRLESLEEVVVSNDETGGEIFELHDVLSNDQEEPSNKAARKLDWQEFVAGLLECERLIIEFVIQGKALREAAQFFGFSDSSMQNSKRSLAAKLLDFMSTEILTEIQRRPRWREDLLTTKEKMACRR